MKFWKMNLVKLSAVLLCLLAMGSRQCIAADDKDDDRANEQGTTAEEIAKLKLAAPAEVKVVVLPFWEATSNEYSRRAVSAATYMLLEREGFKMVPLIEGFKAVDSDKQIEPGQPLRREDALRIAKPFEADWVVYGEVKEMRARKKRGAFKSSKNLFATLRLAVADCETGELFYWKSRTDKVGGSGMFGGFNLKGTKLIRLGATVATRNSLDPLFKALPKHEVKGAVPDNDALLKFMVQTWPDLAKDD